MELFEGGIYTRGGVRVKGEKKEKATENTETAEKEESGNEGETCSRHHLHGARMGTGAAAGIFYMRFIRFEIIDPVPIAAGCSGCRRRCFARIVRHG